MIQILKYYLVCGDIKFFLEKIFLWQLFDQAKLNLWEVNLNYFLSF